MKEKDLDFVITELKKKFSGSVDYMSGVNDALYTVLRKVNNKANDVLESINRNSFNYKQSILDSIPEGYSQIIQIVKNGLKGDTKAVRSYMIMFIDLHPNNRLSAGFKNILEGKESTVILDHSKDTLEMMSPKEWLKSNNYPRLYPVFDAMEQYASYVAEIKAKDAFEAGWNGMVAFMNSGKPFASKELYYKAWKEKK